MDFPEFVGDLVKGLFDADLEDLRERIEALPWVASARVSRIWPDTLAVKVVERQPYARWGQGQMIDRNSEVFTPNADEIPQDLPLLSAPPGHEPEAAMVYEDLRARLAGSLFEPTGLVLDARGEWRMSNAAGIELHARRQFVQTLRRQCPSGEASKAKADIEGAMAGFGECARGGQHCSCVICAGQHLADFGVMEAREIALCALRRHGLMHAGNGGEGNIEGDAINGRRVIGNADFNQRAEPGLGTAQRVHASLPAARKAATAVTRRRTPSATCVHESVAPLMLAMSRPTCSAAVAGLPANC